MHQTGTSASDLRPQTCASAERLLSASSALPLLSSFDSSLFSPYMGISFFWPLAPLTQIMLHWVRQPDGQREVNLAANWRGKKKITSKSLTCPTLLYIVFLIHNVRRLLLWFFFFLSLNTSLTASSQSRESFNSDREWNTFRPTNMTSGLLPLCVINSIWKLTRRLADSTSTCFSFFATWVWFYFLVFPNIHTTPFLSVDVTVSAAEHPRL